MGNDSFVHLHVHTEYSMLDGAIKTAGLAQRAAEFGMPAVAMTDHGNMFGAYDFHQQAKAAGVKPIIGIEAYVAPESRHHKKPVFWARGDTDQDIEGGKDVAGGGAYTHMTMWARNATGLRNLMRLSSLASYEGFYRKPRMDRELIAEYASGIVASTGCPSGEVQTRLRMGQWREALQAASDWRDIFGAGNLVVELMDHGLAIEKQTRDGLLALSHELGLPLVASNDAHYLTPDDADAHDSLLAIGVGKNKHDEKRFRFAGQGYDIKTAVEMRELFAELPQACNNTLALADAVEDYGDVFAHKDRMPRYPFVPDGATQASELRRQVEVGVVERYGPSPAQAVRDRVEFELDVLTSQGFDAYFLVVADMVRFAKRQGILVGPGRGSAAGSIVAYTLGITELCPLEHGLLFERFLNPERVSPPDIDLDFDDTRRGEVVTYLADTYGQEYTSQVNTLGVIKSKAALKDAARILAKPYALGEKVTKLLPPDAGGTPCPLDAAVDEQHDRYAETEPLRDLLGQDPDAADVYATARKLEGTIRGTGVHAAAVILSSEPLLDVVPMHRRDRDDATITGFDYPTCEALGLVKMDVLGVRNLGIVDECLRQVQTNRGITLDRADIPLDDEATFDLLSRGDTLGVFQMDSSGIRKLLRAMRPRRFADVSAAIALYRPGPMAANAHMSFAERANGREEPTPIHPELGDALTPILGETHHLLVYQEQIMQVARDLAGYSLGQADILRKAMSKKKADVLDTMHGEFTSGMVGNGFTQQAADTLWNVMLPFSGYAFNRSHAAGYGMLGYWTAYLKANYPAEYMAALLSSVDGDKDKMATYLADARHGGVRVSPPDVNTSTAGFTAVGDEVRFGLSAVRNVGPGVVDGITTTRDHSGTFVSFDDFLDRAPKAVCNKRAVQGLIHAGAFDTLGHTRNSLEQVHEQAVQQRQKEKKQAAVGQDDLFSGLEVDDRGDVSIPVDALLPEWPKLARLERERDVLGLYVSGHPLDDVAGVLVKHRDTSIGDAADTRVGSTVTVAGMLTGVQHKISKAGNAWISATVEDLDASMPLVVFGNAARLYRDVFADDTVVQVTGKMQDRDGDVNMIVDQVCDLGVARAAPGVRVSLPHGYMPPDVVDRLVDIFRTHEGQCVVEVTTGSSVGASSWRALQGFHVDGSTAFASEVKALLGADALHV